MLQRGSRPDGRAPSFLVLLPTLGTTDLDEATLIDVVAVTVAMKNTLAV